MSVRYLLDTKTISYAASGRSPRALQKISERPPSEILISCISCAEIWYGLIRKPGATKLERAIAALFAEAEILPWTIDTANSYAELRTQMERVGKSLAPLDMLIAAHTLEAGATLVTNDRAFQYVPGLEIEDWTAE